MASLDPPRSLTPGTEGSGTSDTGIRRKHGKRGKHGDFSSLDSNGDGNVSAAEAKDSRLSKRFADVDTDGDGQVTFAEQRAFRELMKDPATRAKFKMDKKDANGDGVLTADEMGGGKKAGQFERTDTNGDGQVTLEELAAAKHGKEGKRGEHRQNGKRGKHGKRDFSSLDTDASGGVSLAEAGESRLARHFTDVDTDGDGQVAAAEQSAFHELMKDPATRAKFILDKKDANGDGVLSADEAGGGKKAGHFERWDSNADGQVTLEELTAAKHARRGEHAKRGKHTKRGKHGDAPVTN